ncbi:MAG TPA: 16S rRNA (adenine(1518)-N(6)/adenine(1519)-N(6))-dimethyltransferase RsmA [Moheibacter sp.]|nr:16S rRNA (adenine(1518)-N(6)/adenine(1519)-N(6))-dimethyltransferase RsmA [Moheibacter sp.]
MNVRAKKHLGQHFLKDEGIAEKIVDALTWEGYGHVLEIGPGMGVLTKFALQKGHDIAVVEIDEESVVYLNQQYPTLRVYAEDFLKMDLAAHFSTQPLAILGNFPYNISSQIVFKIIENRSFIPEMVGMFQKEVAERICAQPGSKTYGILSVLTQAFYQTDYLFTVAEDVFIPPPKVKSGVMRMQRYRETLEVDEKMFFTVVKAAFNQRRKTLRNALKSLLPLDYPTEDELLKLRAEQLSVDQFLMLTHKITTWK